MSKQAAVLSIECRVVTLYCAGPQKTVVTSGHSVPAGNAG